MKSRQVEAVKRRLAPWLEEPYFQVVTEIDYVVGKKCRHVDTGARLDEVARKAYCCGCGAEIDAFDALLHYAKSERRLQHEAIAIRQHKEQEAAKKAADKMRRPHVRAVVHWTPLCEGAGEDLAVVGYDLTLDCGHTQRRDGERRVKTVTCQTCQKTTIHKL